jgi:hypothetical protein
VAGHREAFHGLGVQDVREFNSDQCSVFRFLREEKENKKEKLPGGFFFPGQSRPVGCTTLGSPRLLGAIKSNFKGKFLNFMCT